MRRGLIFSLLLVCFGSVVSLANTEGKQVQLTKSAQHCLQCHGNDFYTFHNSWMETKETKRMNPYLIIDSMAYQSGVHGTFSCDDCHSSDYATYPHNSELKLEPKYTCQDCHGGDPEYAYLHFDEIESEVQQSVHANLFGEDEPVRCDMCHDPHTNRLVARSEKYNLKDIVRLNNAQCLYCHGESNNAELYSDKDISQVMDKHSWLPNQTLHFSRVRCIECHSAKEDTFMVAHRILGKEEAVHNCRECHSKDNMLEAKLYKYIVSESRTGEDGFTNNAYLIGANRSKFLNIFGIIGLALVLGGIAIHTIMRIVKK